MIRLATLATLMALGACSPEKAEESPSIPPPVVVETLAPQAPSPVSAEQARDAEAAIEAYLQTRDFNDAELHYAYGLFDLNADGADEIIVHVGGLHVCGATGGCPLYILTPDGDGWRRVGGLLATKPPIGVLETSTHGWRDLVIRQAAGAFASHLPRPVRFDGRVYPLDGVEPALDYEPASTVLITRDAVYHTVQ